MARTIKGLTINEGFTDLGSFDIEITHVETESYLKNELFTIPSDQKSLLFKLVHSGDEIPSGYKIEASVEQLDGTDGETIELISNVQGYFEINVPKLPAVKYDSLIAGQSLKLKLIGPLTRRADECYLNINTATQEAYTLITDIEKYTDTLTGLDYLRFYAGASTFYDVDPELNITGAESIGIDSEGKVYKRTVSTGSFTLIDQLQFTKFGVPSELTNLSEGLYLENSPDTGSKTDGVLGDTNFENYRIKLINPEYIPIKITLSVSIPGVLSAESYTISGLEPGSMNINIITLSASPEEVDDSATLEELADVCGSFTNLLNFLTTSPLSLDTIAKVQKAGPIKFIDGYDAVASTVSNDDLKKVQAHVDLYFINKELNDDPEILLEQNQHLIDLGYDNIQKIANTSKDKFLAEVVTVDFPLFEAAQYHEIAVQNLKFLNINLAAKLVDLKLNSPAIPEVALSKFAQKGGMANQVTSCGCDDCQSGISPFAYLMDLIQYAAKHINVLDTFHTYYCSIYPIYEDFFAILNIYFKQPFDQLNVDCDTLHREYCRSRLVTEVIEKYFHGYTLGTLQNDAHTRLRNNFYTMVYHDLLAKAGTSYDELRKVVTISNSTEKAKEAKKLCDRIGICTYQISSSALTVDKMWLVITTTGLASNELNADKLEDIFGFAKTYWTTLPVPSTSKMEQWRSKHLRDLWERQDYYGSNYSREGVNHTDLSTFKANWKPILDPDIIGLQDMANAIDLDAIEIWRHRKKFIDTFLDYYRNDQTNILSRTSVDLNARILRIPGQNILSHTIKGKKVYIENSSSVWTDFEVLNMKLINAGTDLFLKKTSASTSQNNIFQPQGSSPKIRYKREIVVDSFVNVGTALSLSWTEPLIDYANIYHPSIGGYLTIQSDNVTDPEYDYAGTGLYIISSVNFVSYTQVDLVLGQSPSSAFLAGKLTLVYEPEYTLFTTEMVDPENIVNELLSKNEVYTYYSGSPSTSGTYTVWTTPTWTGISGSTDYERLKDLFRLLSDGEATSSQLNIIKNELSMDKTSFIRMMQIFSLCENYLSNTYTFNRPKESELYELSSILFNCSKAQWQSPWVKEEIVHLVSSTPLYLKLNKRNFWKSINEPLQGKWDPSLQTIPASFGSINSDNVAIVDPELIKEIQLVQHPSSEPFRLLYDARKTELETKRTTIESFILPFDVTGFDKILNYINTGSSTSSFVISPYSTLDDLVLELKGTNTIKQKLAIDTVWSAFAIDQEDFLNIINLKTEYETNNPANLPSRAQLNKAIKIFVTAYKRMQLYPNTGGWIDEEITGSGPNLSTGEMVYYYNVIQMNLPIGRSNVIDRIEWQKTLEAWNRMPFVHPDIMESVNIINFVSTDPIYQLWSARKNNINATSSGYYTILSGYFYSTATQSNLITDFEEQLDLIIGRAKLNNFTANSGIPYLHYFEEIDKREKNKEDILPYLDQLEITPSEYRFLRKIYDVLLTSGSTSTPLLQMECEDLINIFIAIRFRYNCFEMIEEEWVSGILLCPDDFQIYKTLANNFPLANLPSFNKWRSPHHLRRNWLETLEKRIERNEAVANNWKSILNEVDDVNMPYLRDGLIGIDSHTIPFEEKAEIIALKYFIETRDNCCSKHTRVSFAIETIQGLLFALQSGIYDETLNINGFSLQAPHIKEEWKWIGSYATWRSAMFVHLYPENLLYPSLKRSQSPGFVELTNNIQGSNNFNETSACQAAKDYKTYLDDITNLEIVYTATTLSKVESGSHNDCCDQINYSQATTTYFFGRSTQTNNCYWSKCYETSPGSNHSFWYKLDLPANAKIVGCNVYGNRGGTYWWSFGTILRLFYTYQDKNKLKIACLKLDPLIPNSNWSGEIDLPDLPEFVSPTQNAKCRISHAVLCQGTIEYLNPVFLVFYQEPDGSDRYYSIPVRYNISVDSFEFLKNGNQMFQIGPHNLSYLPYSGILHTVKNCNNTGPELDCGFTWLFPGHMVVGLYMENGGSVTAFNFRGIPGNGTLKWAVPLSKPGYENDIIIGVLDPSNAFKYYLIKFFYYKATSGALCILDGGYAITLGVVIKKALTFGSGLDFISPLSSLTNATNIYSFSYQGTKVGSKISLTEGSTTGDLVSFDKFALLPKGISTVSMPIISETCSINISTPALNTKLIIEANTNLAGNHLASYYSRTQKQLTYIYEGYYFVPMLLALELQRNGHYETALAWYRSVYDYTQDYLSNRKIFYGLELEATITESYIRVFDWLRDPLNPHAIAGLRRNAYTKYTLMNIIECINAYADREFTLDTVESVPRARKLYSTALELLKTNELRFKINPCDDIAEGGGGGPVDPDDPTFTNLERIMQTKITEIGNIEAIQEVSDTIFDYFNDDDNTATTEEKFIFAFETIAAAKHDNPLPDTETVAEVMDGYAERMNDAYRYIYAEFDPGVFNLAIANDYKTKVASISGLEIDAVALTDSESQLGWLNEAIPKNSEPLKFSFINSGGVQKLTGASALNPLNPNQVSYAANVNYSNANTFVPYHSPNQLSYTYSPLIDFAFCTPENPVYRALFLKSNVELYKIFNCRNIGGMLRELNPYAAATDSSTGIPIIGASGNLVLPGTMVYSPSQYRFKILIERAKQLVQQSQQLESMYLAAMEKEDAENYNLMKAKQEMQTANATIKLQDLRINQANDEVKVAELQRDKNVFVQGHFNTLLSEGLNKFEKESLALLTESIGLMGNAAAMQNLATIAFAAQAIVYVNGLAVQPQNFVEYGAGLASAVAQGFGSQASEFSTKASIASTKASIQSQIATYERRSQEWDFQSKLAGEDIKISNQQIAVANDNVRIVTQERQIAQMNAEHAQDSYEFLKNKFTNAELYNWMGNVLKKCYSFMLNLSNSVAKTAERQLFFERQKQAGPFILDDYWAIANQGLGGLGTANDRRGLTGSARLLVDITRLEQYAFDTNKRKLQLSKILSLSQNFPVEFQRFKETGVLNFELTNKQFDYDFPGHYLRLINSVKTTVIGLIPVYDGIKASLTVDTISYTVIGDNTFQKVPIKRLELDSVALTSTTNATGVFEMQAMQGELLNPFEGVGIESRWEFKMPQFSNRMDFNNIADVLINVEYTALDSYLYRTQVLQNLDNKLNFNRSFSFKNDFPDQWFELTEAQAGPSEFGITLDLRRENYPLGIDDLKLNSAEIILYFVRANGFDDEIDVLDFSKVSTQNSGGYFGGSTTNGRLNTNAMMNGMGDNPVAKLRLLFDNTNDTNRNLFAMGAIEDILIVIPCKAELRTYPL